MLIPLMSRICKLWAEVKREFWDLGENYLAGEGRHLDSRFRGNDNWWGKPHPTNLDSRSFDSFDKTPTFAESSEGRGKGQSIRGISNSEQGISNDEVQGKKKARRGPGNNVLWSFSTGRELENQAARDI